MYLVSNLSKKKIGFEKEASKLFKYQICFLKKQTKMFPSSNI